MSNRTVQYEPSGTVMTTGEVIGAIALAFALFGAGFLVRGWSTPNPWVGVSLIVPETSSYDCKIGENGHFSVGSKQ